MPVKQRKSKTRNPLITPEAIALFRRGLALQKIGANKTNYRINETTAEQDEYRTITRRLHWQLLDCACGVGPLDIAEGDHADVPDSEIVDDGTWRSTVPNARPLHALLKKGMRRRPTDRIARAARTK